MLPAAQTPLQALFCRLRAASLTALAAALVGGALVSFAPEAAAAQDLERQLPDNPISPLPAAPPPETSDTAQIAFEADKVEYNQNAETVTASGNVVLRRQQQSVRANTVTWNRTTGQIVATGDVRLIDEDGNQLYTDRVELTDELKTGAMENLLLAMREGGRLAAQSGVRDANGDVVLQHAAYTGCEVQDRHGCPKKPTWRVTAKQVTYDDSEKLVMFKGARLEVLGIVQLPLPGLKISTDGHPMRGFMVPDISSTPSNGIEISDSYYLKLGKNRDLTGTAYLFTKSAPMASIQYRALTDIGAYQITAYATASNKIPIFGSTTTSRGAFRGYIFANGQFQLDPHWSVTASIRQATDRTFLRRYDISRDDRLRSMVDVERIDSDSYLSISGYATQTMRVGVQQGLIPVALPVIDYRRRLADPLLGGKIELEANTMAIGRTAGQDTQRAFAKAQWTLSRITNWGQEVTFTGLLRGDLYHSDQNATSPALYAGESGWQTRGIATAAVDVKWPLVGAIFGGTQVLTPRIQLVATPRTPNLSIPNEDARAVDLEDSNLFALNRFPGYDRIEDGVRFTYGLDWQFERPRWRIMTTVGQSVRLSNRASILPDGTGLSKKLSDIVGRTEIRYRDFVSIVHRFRLDKDNFVIRRNEFDATIGSSRTYAEIGYTKLNRDIAAGIEDLQNREEARVAGRVAFANYWSMFGSAVVNLTDRNEDPINGSNGFQPLRTRFGVAYEDDCLQISLTWRRDYQTTGDAQRGNSFQLKFSLKGLGSR